MHERIHTLHIQFIFSTQNHSLAGNIVLRCARHAPCILHISHNIPRHQTRINIHSLLASLLHPSPFSPALLFSSYSYISSEFRFVGPLASCVCVSARWRGLFHPSLARLPPPRLVVVGVNPKRVINWTAAKRRVAFHARINHRSTGSSSRVHENAHGVIRRRTCFLSFSLSLFRSFTIC